MAMSEKIQVSFMVDSEVWKEAKNKLGTTRSEFLEEQLRLAIDLSEDEENSLRKEIAELQNEINARESRLCKIRAERLEHERSVNVFDGVMGTVNRIVDKAGFIGKDQLKNISKQQEVPYKSLLDHVYDLGYDVRNYGLVIK